MKSYNIFHTLVILIIISSIESCDINSPYISAIADKILEDSSFQITYDQNGATSGTVPVDSEFYANDKVATILDNTGNLVNIDGVTTAYRFDGWNTVADGSGTTYAAGAEIDQISANLTLYVQWTEYAVGDIGPAGGYIYHIAGTYSGDPSWRYLEVAPVSTEWSWKIWSNDTETDTFDLGTSIDSGYGNTRFIRTLSTISTEIDTAPELCWNLSFGGFSDWYLPSIEELALICFKLYDNDPALGDFDIDTYYWSSSDAGSAEMWAYNFRDRLEFPIARNGLLRTRAARRF